MKRKSNALVWIGFGIALLAFLSYFFLFSRFPATRDVPWANLLLFAVGGWLLGTGLKRAFGQPERYRGKVSGVILGSLGILVFGLFCVYTLYFSKQLPASSDAPRAGQRAPDFALMDAGGKPVTLSDLLQKNRAVLLVFYRGYW